MTKKNLKVFVLNVAIFILFASVSYANSIINYNLTNDGSIVAAYDEDNGKITVTGAGRIERELWHQMVNGITGGSHGDVIFWWSNGFSGNVDIKFVADEGTLILLPEDSSELFYYFQGKIDFNDSVSTQGVKNMSTMFRQAANFNEDISFFDTSSVTDMSNMFRLASSFNQDINNWDVSNVRNMKGTFFGTPFNQPLDNWDVSNVTDMELMFNFNKVFNQPLNSWDVSNVKTMRDMFCNAQSFNQPLDNWDVSKLEDAQAMFLKAKNFDQPLNSWDVSNVSNFKYMFFDAEKFNQALNNWDLTSAQDLGGMFVGAKLFNQDLNDWDLSNVKDIGGMFANAESFNQSLDSWDVSNVRSMGGLFLGATSFDQNFESWNWDIDIGHSPGSGSMLGMFESTKIKKIQILLDMEKNPFGAWSPDIFKNCNYLEEFMVSGLRNTYAEDKPPYIMKKGQVLDVNDTRVQTTEGEGINFV